MKIGRKSNKRKSNRGERKKKTAGRGPEMRIENVLKKFKRDIDDSSKFCISF